MATEKLFWADTTLLTFDARVLGPGAFQGRASLVLDRTAFYAEAGGQLGDRGALSVTSPEGALSFRVEDVQADDEGVIHHLLASDAPPASTGGAVRGAVDGPRRRDQTAHHTAQHMLSRALLDEAGAATISARLGEDTCTIDVAKSALSDADLARAEDLVNAVVRDDVVIRSYFPTEGELASLALRRAPKVATNIRIVEVTGYDVTPCGGTHCTRSGQVGAVRVVATERLKGLTRIVFHAAARALLDARTKEATLASLAREFTCGLLDVPAAVARLRADLKAKEGALGVARGELAALVADGLLATHPPRVPAPGDVPRPPFTPIVVDRPEADLAMLRVLAGRLTARPDVFALCGAPAGGDDGAYLVVVQRGAQCTVDCGAWLKGEAAKAASLTGQAGRGGGRPERAEGRLPAAAFHVAARALLVS